MTRDVLRKRAPWLVVKRTTRTEVIKRSTGVLTGPDSAPEAFRFGAQGLLRAPALGSPLFEKSSRAVETLVPSVIGQTH